MKPAFIRCKYDHCKNPAMQGEYCDKHADLNNGTELVDEGVKK